VEEWGSGGVGEWGSGGVGEVFSSSLSFCPPRLPLPLSPPLPLSQASHLDLVQAWSGDRHYGKL